jgi:predicted MPP superfamily phosphohydrolase
LSISARALYEARHIDIDSVDIKIKNLKRSYSIVQLSDIHIGGIIDKDFIKKLVLKVNRLKPDLVVITGDLVDIKLKYALSALEELKNLNTVYGTYFIVGNHEYHHGLEEIISVVNSLGIKTLENENLYIGDSSYGFNLVGVYDYFGYRVGHHQPDLKKSLQNIDENSPTILLAHQPLFIEEVGNNIDLVLSGHTHGGQIYPFKALVKLVQPYLEGLYRHNDNTQIYVNRGTGFWGPPMRLGASSQISFITIS